MNETERQVEESPWSFLNFCLGAHFSAHPGKGRSVVLASTTPGTATGSGVGCGPTWNTEKEEGVSIALGKKLPHSLEGFLDTCSLSSSLWVGTKSTSRICWQSENRK